MTNREDITCVAIDDEPMALLVIEQFCRRRGGMELTCFSEPRVGLEAIRQQQPDLVFLDIQMNSISGLDIADALPPDCCLVFTTAYAQYALEGFNLDAVDFLLFATGWDARWGTEAYFGDYPCIDEEVLQHILNGNYKGIGFDVIGLDPIADENLTRHKALFAEKDIVNIENLKNLGLCGTEPFWFACLPLKLESSDGAPARAIAWFED